LGKKKIIFGTLGVFVTRFKERRTSLRKTKKGGKRKKKASRDPEKKERYGGSEGCQVDGQSLVIHKAKRGIQKGRQGERV